MVIDSYNIIEFACHLDNTNLYNFARRHRSNYKAMLSLDKLHIIEVRYSHPSHMIRCPIQCATFETVVSHDSIILVLHFKGVAAV